MASIRNLLIVASAAFSSCSTASPAVAQTPTVAIKNGSYYGAYSSAFDQDLFLGMPFAQPPVGQLRFKNPRSLNTSWTGVRNATQYGYWCYGTFNDPGYNPSEDCLTINVVRPSGFEGQALPVAAWIYGGGYFAVCIASRLDRT